MHTPREGARTPATDGARLKAAGREDWERWRQAAADILQSNIDDIQEHTTTEDPIVHDRALGAEAFDDDLTWYTDCH